MGEALHDDRHLDGPVLAAAGAVRARRASSVAEAQHSRTASSASSGPRTPEPGEVLARVGVVGAVLAGGGRADREGDVAEGRDPAGDLAATSLGNPARVSERGAVHGRGEDEALGRREPRPRERREALRLAADEVRLRGGDVSEGDEPGFPWVMITRM